MTDTLIKDKNNESLQNDFEPLETDENQEQKPKKNIKSKLIKYALLFIPIFLIIAGIILNAFIALLNYQMMKYGKNIII